MKSVHWRCRCSDSSELYFSPSHLLRKCPVWEAALPQDPDRLRDHGGTDGHSSVSGRQPSRTGPVDQRRANFRSVPVSFDWPGKFNLLLGFDRHLPGFDRYSVLGDDSDGSFNLQVENANKNDEAKYECQVGPGRGNPPIRASAFLTVNCMSISLTSEVILLLAVPPTNIDILNHLSGSRIEVAENEEVEISCKVSNAKPRARINWFRNNVAFNPGLGQ